MVGHLHLQAMDESLKGKNREGLLDSPDSGLPPSPSPPFYSLSPGILESRSGSCSTPKRAARILQKGEPGRQTGMYSSNEALELKWDPRSPCSSINILCWQWNSLHINQSVYWFYGVELGYCLLSRKRMLMQEHALLKSCAMFILDLCMRTISESSPF